MMAVPGRASECHRDSTAAKPQFRHGRVVEVDRTKIEVRTREIKDMHVPALCACPRRRPFQPSLDGFGGWLGLFAPLSLHQ
jgi:hypothetical protein